jgi:hypothetical protein
MAVPERPLLHDRKSIAYGQLALAVLALAATVGGLTLPSPFSIVVYLAIAVFVLASAFFADRKLREARTRGRFFAYLAGEPENLVRRLVASGFTAVLVEEKAPSTLPTAMDLLAVRGMADGSAELNSRSKGTLQSALNVLFNAF